MLFDRYKNARIKECFLVPKSGNKLYTFAIREDDPFYTQTKIHLGKDETRKIGEAIIDNFDEKFFNEKSFMLNAKFIYEESEENLVLSQLTVDKVLIKRDKNSHETLENGRYILKNGIMEIPNSAAIFYISEDQNDEKEG